MVAFHPNLNTEKNFVVRSFNHTFEQLNDLGYLSNEMLPYFDPITGRQLKIVLWLFMQKKERFSLSEMF